MTNFTHRAPLPSPLHARTSELCASNEWLDQNGFTVPARYATEWEESSSLLTRVTMSDLSARLSWKFEGPDAAAYLSFATITDVTALDAGQTTRTAWCDDQGFVRGEGTLVRFGRDEFELSTTIRDLAWMMDGTYGFDVKIKNVTGSRAVIGIRGPMATALLTSAGFMGAGAGEKSDKAQQPAWRSAQVALVKDEAHAAYELWTEAEDGIVVWDRLWRSGASLGVMAAGARVLESLRIESATPLPGVDWVPAQSALHMEERHRPEDLGFAPDLSRRFNGVESLRHTRVASRQRLVLVSAHSTLSPGPLSTKSDPAGHMTSSTWSQSQSCAFALAWVNQDTARPGAMLTAASRNGAQNVEIVRAVFAHSEKAFTPQR